jgi:site-specific DNA recombinase
VRTVGYIRVSTEEQVKEGISIDNQIERIKAYCQYKGYVLQEVIKDEGMSGGKNRQREGFVSLLAHIEQNDFGTYPVFSGEVVP